MLKVQIMDHQVINNKSKQDSEANCIEQQQQKSTSPKRMNSSDSVLAKTPNPSPVHHSHPVPQRQMTTGSIKSASQGSSPAG